jgi:signal transduction histidine kinase
MPDITERRLLKAKSNEVTATLIEQRDRLQGLNDAKDEFISLASHQLRTPATVIKQYTEMLHSGFVGDIAQEQMDMLAVVHKSNQRQLDIIEDLLRVAKVDAGKVYLQRSYCDVVLEVETAIREQAVLFQSRRQRVVFNKPEKAVFASIDPKLMLMVLQNILDNAGKYSFSDTAVTIIIRQNTEGTTIAIKDSGVGIRTRDRQKLFKKFSRIDNPLSTSVIGTGLGLYWAKKIIDLHKGSIEVTSKLHSGSTFTVHIPTIPALPLPRLAIL